MPALDGLHDMFSCRMTPSSLYSSIHFSKFSIRLSRRYAFPHHAVFFVPSGHGSLALCGEVFNIGQNLCYEMNRPRQSRIDTSGALHHVICRGIDRQKIFTDQNDYLLFLKRLAAWLTETRTSCIAWALIPNPFHLLLRTRNVPISLLMKRRLTGYNALPAARRAYSRFVQSGREQGRRPDLTGGGLLRSHGGGTGIKALRATGTIKKAMSGYGETELLSVKFWIRPKKDSRKHIDSAPEEMIWIH
jgi:REP element-mobilizing transposase RayT